MTISYNLNIPAAPNNPSVDQPKMQTNTNNISQLIGIDHVTFNDATNPNGYHTVIHQTLQGSDPAAIVGIGQIYSKNVTVGIGTDTQLFYRTGNGGVSQLTGNSALPNGWQQLGGVIMQWGTVSPVVNQTLTVVNFPRAFPNACFVVVVTEKRTANPNNVDTVYVNAQSTTSFSYNATTSGTGFASFSWIAIGN